MNGPSGYWFIDGMDVWNTFAIAIRKGTSGFLQYSERKDSITHDWPDQNGLDIDTSKVFFKERLITLQCWLMTETEDDFWVKRKAFSTLIAKPGQRRISIAAHKNRSYMCIYKSCSEYQQVTGKALKGIPANFIVHEFNLTFLEPMPQLETSEIFIAADNGAFLIV